MTLDEASLENGTYALEQTNWQSFTLTGGVYSMPNPPSEWGEVLVNYYESAFGELNADGVDDAAHRTLRGRELTDVKLAATHLLSVGVDYGNDRVDGTTGYDVRPETREQVESLGAKFVDTGVSAVGEGGYARELTEAEKGAQEAKLGKAIAQCDVLITTAAVPGKQAPQIVSEMMVNAMRPGAVVVDMAAEQGGNVFGTVAGSEVRVGPAHVVGPVNLPSRMPVHASEMIAKNLLNFVTPMVVDGAIRIDTSDEVVAGTALTLDGAAVHPQVKQVLGL